MVWGSKLVRLARRLGIATDSFDRYYLFGWEGNERYRVHAELGDAFTLVTPGGNWIYIADPDAIWDTLKRPHEFGRNLEQLAVLNVYGKNLSTTEGQEWQKHRKITAATFTEKNNELVWQSSLSQAQGMLDYWVHRAPEPVRSVADDCRTFTLNVLAAALFSKPYPFEGRNEPTDTTDESYQYRDSLSKILQNIILIVIFGGEKLRTSKWMPISWQQAGAAVANFRSYVLGLIDEEKVNVENGVQNRKDLVAALVRASLAQKKEGRDMTVTEEEIISNTFVYGFAGNDTTAITLAHTIVNLAAHPETQDWIAEETQRYLPTDDFTEWTYPTWAKLKRCQAVVMESLRLCHPLGSSSKLTKEASSLNLGGKTYTIPTNTHVQLNFCALHTNTHSWGATALEWDPTRFIYHDEGEATAGIEAEQLRPTVEKRYLPWSYGERVCPGKKFSQVELAATLAILFRKHSVDPVPEKGETLVEARKRAQKVSLDIQMTLLNEMYQPQSLGLKWTERTAA
ncbi:cytochrome P450 [Mytilinidion resinicola]|uniref:Cytochrome P450 n=1 Tax=Mytilinidion resinicola TaxID=574789 RepID=A0A6A6YD88_9PEZI|nr:cytochrome P450 [Mytilinidion resinicola]KAF2806680.1 cytochrome P450 [Mytilinidion resinicola]